jgi:hypothetical protein
MQRYLPVLIVALGAVVGAILLQASELLHRVALDNSASLAAGGRAELITWQMELARNWQHDLIYLIGGGLLLYCPPVLAVLLWSSTRKFQWFLVLLFCTLIFFDIQAFQESVTNPNNDRKGCEVCMGPIFAHAAASLVAFLLFVVGLFRQKHA